MLVVLVTVFVACKKDSDVEFSTFDVKDEKIVPSSTSVELSCEVVCSATIKELYLQYGTKDDFSKCEEVQMTKGKSSYSVKIDNLTANTTYYVRYLAVNSYSSMTSKKTSKFKTLIKSDPGEQFEPEYVDLGLSVKWATCNVGADSPEDYGDYFAWGEVEPKETYNWSTYKYCNGTNKTLTKYCGHSSYGNNGFTDGKTILDLEDDAATVNWGGAWRMPTDAELTELREKCKWTWTSQNDVNGYKVVGPNGNSIFLPAAGYKDGESLLITRSFGNYWSSSLYPDYSDLAYSVYFYSDVVVRYGSNRDHGRSVRPVWGGGTDDSTTKNKYTITVSANSSSYGTVSGGGMYEEGTQVTLTATPKVGYKFTEWHDGNTDNPRVITVTQDESYTAVFVEKTMSEGYEYVDLGLSVKWATCNVGATTPEDYGDYFAWGEVTTKNSYDWSTYKYCEGSDVTLIKYCTESSYGKDGFVDNKIMLDPTDDAAIVNWGGEWRMPTKAEQDELRDKCTWTWITTENGVSGYRVTSNVLGYTDRSIFLPAAGSKSGSTCENVGTFGSYWSNLLGSYDEQDYIVRSATSISFSSSYKDADGVRDRSSGRSVRPVYGERKYIISVFVNNASYGNVMGATSAKKGTQVTLTAIPKLGYKFKEWNDGNTDNPRVITVTQDESYTAVFVEKTMSEGYEYVDLGLSVKWATCNVGATTPEDYGDYFAWGEVTTKNSYDWSTYKYCEGSDVTLIKYCTESSYGKDGFVDNKIMLDPTDDAAIVNWGGEWRMPTKAEQDELRDKCTWTWITTENGVSGYRVTSNVLGYTDRSIFLPAAGSKSGSTCENVGTFGSYWSNLLGSYDEQDYIVRSATSISFSSSYKDADGVRDRSSGRSVRPVYGERKYIISVFVNNASYGNVMGATSAKKGTQVTLTAIPKLGYKFKEWNDGNTDNPRVITVTQDESYTAYFEKESTENARHEYVDLGLPSGLKWATCNVGATTPEEYGDYFAWGETQPKENYHWTTYLHCNGTSKTITKYCNNSSFGNNGFTDNKIILDPEDDAATVNWGGLWRMPTYDEFDELKTKCTWIWATQSGVNGYKVTGLNGNSIFLPAAGTFTSGASVNVGKVGDYWTSSLYRGDVSTGANRIYFYLEGVYWYQMSDRYVGRSVRPVCQ